MQKPAIPAVLSEKKAAQQGKTAVKEKYENEIRVTVGKFTCSPSVRAMPNAYKKWKFITKFFTEDGRDLLSHIDDDLLERYCLAHEDYVDLRERRTKLMEYEIGLPDIDTHLPNAIANKLKLWLKIPALVELDKAIMSKSDYMQKMEDRMFLNPLSRVRAGCRPQKIKDQKLAKEGFGEV